MPPFDEEAVSWRRRCGAHVGDVTVAPDREKYDDEARKRLIDNRIAANLGLEHARTAARGRERGRKRKNGLRGRRKPLKRLNPDKEIKVNSFDFLGWALLDSRPIWPNLGFLG